MSRMDLLLKVYSNKKLSVFLKSVSYITVFFSVAVYTIVLYKAFSLSYPTLFKCILTSGGAFALVSVYRRIVNAPRPYEIYQFYDVLPKNKKGRSFPGRHAFSVFTVATLSLCISPVVFAIALILGVALCICRVLLGIHFIKDVSVGALLGIFSGAMSLYLSGLTAFIT